MKRSTFLFLLHFTLSTSVHFEIIKEPGIHLWSIPEDENSDPHYVSVNRLSSSKAGTSKFRYSQRDIPSSSSAEQSTSILETDNTYIVLKISEDYGFSLYYWIGAQSSEVNHRSPCYVSQNFTVYYTSRYVYNTAKKKNVALSAGFILKNQILEHKPKVNLKRFYRQAEGVETFSFSRFLKLPIPRIKSRLYRIAGSTGQFIMEVPLKYSELNGSDSFVLDDHYTVYLWDSLYSNEFKKQTAKLLKNRLLRVNENLLRESPKFNWIRDEGPDVPKHLNYYVFRKRFLQNMAGVPNRPELPQAPANYSDSELAEQRWNELILYQYSGFIGPQPIPWTVLKRTMLEENNAYVLADYRGGNTLVFLGSNADTAQIIRALSDAEDISRTMSVKDAWQRIFVFRSGDHIPLWVRIYFEKEFEEEKEMSMVDFSSLNLE